LILKSSQFPSFCQALWQQLHGQKSEIENPFIQKIKAVVSSFPGRCVFMAGIHQPDIVHEISHQLNFEFGRKAVTYQAISPAPTSSIESLKNLGTQLEKNEIEALFVIGGNPAHQSPVDFNLSKKFRQAKRSYRFSLTEDETSAVCDWQLPLAHEFEAWSDGQAFDGTLSVHQPLIAPLFQGKNIHEIISLFSGENKLSYTVVTDFWKKKLGTQYSLQWEKIVQNGIFAEKKTRAFNLKPKKSIPMFLNETPITTELEILFRADPHIWDGRFAGNSWLQELPKPLTLLTWGNAALISPALASERKIAPGQVIEITTADGKLKAPAWILPGQEERTVTLHFGYGRTRAGKTVSHLGFNAYQIWNSNHTDFQTGSIAVTSEIQEMACTQSHFLMDEKTLEKKSTVIPSLYEKDPLPAVVSPEAWAMVIDLDHCIGCNACTIACQSENNIPVVGKEGVLRGREMHWIRVDRYFSGEENSPRFVFQPVPCMHCEKAPCEEVCPVAATVHSTEGLNQMVYNRCVGTRYCANNCPYKVRRFNFFSLTSNKGELQKLLQNPEVSVRPRGVMEKCTYCVQRINAARIDAQKDLRSIKDGEIKTACQVTCPTEAITFGNQNDPASKVSQLKKKSRNYALLEELGTRPRTTYLTKMEDGIKYD
jgi:molybdopterin-containing oxidoreductase family iron-sulfur binding subunit